MFGRQILHEKVIVVSGGTKGLGRDLSIACAEQGARVVVAGRDRKAAGVIVDKIDAQGGQAIFVPVDLRKEEDCKSLFDKAVAGYGRVDGFVNYAGVTTIASLLDADPMVFSNVMDVNFKAAFFCCQQAMKYMIKTGGGSIVLINSCHALRGERDRAVYACSKGALLTLSSHIAYNYAAEGIRCNTVTMGWSATEGEIKLRAEQDMSVDELKDQAASAIPMGRMQESSDYIPALLYLLSDESSMTTGSNLQISGGLFI